MLTVNFSMIKSQHRAWEKRLKAFLEGKGVLSDTEAFSHEDCDLGKWLYAEGMVKYGDIPEMQELEEIHVELHAKIRRISQAKHSGKMVLEKDISLIELTNKKIISLLTDIELKIK